MGIEPTTSRLEAEVTLFYTTEQLVFKEGVEVKDD